MRNGWLDKWRLFGFHSVPLWITLILMFLFLMPIYSIQWSYFRPNIGLICVYYWTLKRHQIFSFFSAFLIGLLIDSYSSSPFGTNALLMMLTVAFTIWLAHYFQNASFGAIWFIFCLVALGETLLKWLLLMIYFGRIINPQEIIVNCFSTVLFYPLIVALNVWVQKFLPQEKINE